MAQHNYGHNYLPTSRLVSHIVSVVFGQEYIYIVGTSNYISQILSDVITCPRSVVPEAGTKGRDK